jgi:DNA-binding response OmpR family regulator
MVSPEGLKSTPTVTSETNPSLVIVDDDPHMVATLEAILREEGYAVEGFTDPSTALDRLREGPAPGVIVMDCVMPRLNGGEMLEALREAGVESPVVMVTALSDPGFCIPPGRASVLNKPFAIDDLLAEIGAALDGKRKIQGTEPTRASA